MMSTRSIYQEETLDQSDKTTASLLHLSTFLKYFIPLANYIVPVLIWTLNRQKQFIDANGKQAINFQLSMMIYHIAIVLICLPLIIIFAGDFLQLLDHVARGDGNGQGFQNLSGFVVFFVIISLLFAALFILQVVAVIHAAIHANKGRLYKYPLAISFLKTL